MTPTPTTAPEGKTMIRALTTAVLAALFMAMASVSGGLANAGPSDTACAHASDVAKQRSGVLAARCADTASTYDVVSSGVIPAGISTRLGLNCNVGDAVSAATFTLGSGLTLHQFSTSPTTGDLANPAGGFTWDPPVVSSSGELSVGVDNSGGDANATVTTTCVIATA